MMVNPSGTTGPLLAPTTHAVLPSQACLHMFTLAQRSPKLPFDAHMGRGWNCSTAQWQCRPMPALHVCTMVSTALPPSHEIVVSSVAAGHSLPTKACSVGLHSALLGKQGPGRCRAAVCLLDTSQRFAVQLCYHCSHAGQVRAAAPHLQHQQSSMLLSLSSNHVALL